MNVALNPRLAIAVLLGTLCSGLPGPTGAQLTEELTRAYLWPSSQAEFQTASARIAEDESLVGVTRQEMHDLEEWMRRGPTPRGGAPDVRGDVLDEFVVSAPGNRGDSCLRPDPEQVRPPNTNGRSFSQCTADPQAVQTVRFGARAG